MGIGSGFVGALKAASGGLKALHKNPVLEGKRFSVDVSCAIYTIVHRDGVKEEFHTSPRVPLATVARHFKSYIQQLILAGMRVIIVFDGARHPHKAATNASRAGTREASEPRLKELLKRSDLSKAEKMELNKLRAACMQVTEDMLLTVMNVCKEEGWPYLCAPFEADFQVRAFSPSSPCV